MYRDGNGVTQNLTDAETLIEKSAAQNNVFAFVALSKVIATRDPARAASFLAGLDDVAIRVKRTIPSFVSLYSSELVVAAKVLSALPRPASRLAM